MSKLSFDNLFVDSLPVDHILDNYPRQVSDACFSFCNPVVPHKPSLITYSADTASLLELSSSDIQSPDTIQLLSGAKINSEMRPFAMRYAGHQFGNWAGQLGDGRAINLGDIVSTSQQRWALQLKGAGPTPYSRAGDGFAVLRSSIREFLCSEAMYHLGIPTTRALSLITTGDSITRDMFYDGNPQPEPGAIVCRVAQSFLRFGNFQIHAAFGELDSLKKLSEFTIHNYFPRLLKRKDSKIDKGIYLNWLREVSESTAEMICHWQRVGFVHGVMNTDNMSIHGLTIDYGPYGWLDNYDPQWTPNTTDAQGKRYRFENQAPVAHWNLVQFAQAIYPLIGQVEPIQEIVNEFQTIYQKKWLTMMTQKLGLDSVQQDDQTLIKDLEQLLTYVETDMTIFYRALANFNLKSDLDNLLSDCYYKPQQLTEEYLTLRNQWFSCYSQRLQKNNISQKSRKQLMNSVNPKYTLRNYLSQQAIDLAENGDYTEIDKLLTIIRNPYSDQAEYNEYSGKRPEWARNKAGCSMLSCSS